MLWPDLQLSNDVSPIKQDVKEESFNFEIGQDLGSEKKVNTHKERMAAPAKESDDDAFEA